MLIVLPLPINCPAVIVEVADINPPVRIFAPTRLPVVETRPLEVILVSVPTLVMLGCAFVVTVPAVTAEVTLPLTLAPCMLLIVLPLPMNCPAVIVEVALINPLVNKLAPVTLPVTTNAFDD